jgi:flagellum-specific peptidoglycan hydrolase FlgJ
VLRHALHSADHKVIEQMASVWQDAWLKTMVPPAQATMRKYGVPASVSLSQCIYESSWGLDPLVKAGLNYFGIKATHGEDYCEYNTEEDYVAGNKKILAAFAKYPTAEASFEAHARLLATTQRYAPAMKALPSLTAFCMQLQACGYSTSRDPVTREFDYAAKLLTEIRVRNLKQYDITPDPPAAAIQEAA